jgi:hypothetical protein
MKNHKLAFELASTLDDNESIKIYEGFTERFTEGFLRRTLARVMAIPDRKIKKTRGALFTYLVNQDGRSRNSRD